MQERPKLLNEITHDLLANWQLLFPLFQPL
jgi:hypothetical protein